MSKAYTKEEAREDFLSSVRGAVEYWSTAKGLDAKEKVEGAAFSIMNIIDGTGSPFVSMDLVLRPHPDNKRFAIEDGEDYYEDGMVINDDTYLHDILFNPIDRGFTKA